jgi:hypothetical protein
MKLSPTGNLTLSPPGEACGRPAAYIDLPGVTICGRAYGQQATARGEALAPVQLAFAGLETACRKEQDLKLCA